MGMWRTSITTTHKQADRGVRAIVLRQMTWQRCAQQKHCFQAFLHPSGSVIEVKAAHIFNRQSFKQS